MTKQDRLFDSFSYPLKILLVYDQAEPVIVSCRFFTKLHLIIHKNFGERLRYV